MAYPTVSCKRGFGKLHPPCFGQARLISSQSSIDSSQPAGQLDFVFAHREREFVLRVQPGQRVALMYNGVERKERLYAGREPLYVWTNVELEWEEHHYIEARYWPTTGELRATVNGDPLASWQLEPVDPSVVAATENPGSVAR